MIEPPSSILVVKPSSLGDVVHTLPAVALLKEKWPHSAIRWLVNPEWAPLLKGNPALEEVVLFPRRELGKSLKTQWQWVKAFRKQYRSDLVLDFQGLLRSAIVGRAAKKNLFVGLSDAREGARFFYDRVARVHSRQHAVDRYLALVASLGIEIPETLPWVMPEGSPRFTEGLGSYLLLHPFSRGKGKSMTIDQLEAFCTEFPYPIVLAGRVDPSLQTGRIDRLPHVTNFLNETSLDELIGLLRGAAFVMSVDSGPMHMAAALGKPLLSLHTWSDPALVGPYQKEAWILQDQQLYQVGQMRAGIGKRQSIPDQSALAAFVAARFEEKSDSLRNP